jgi:hypothetical protein
MNSNLITFSHNHEKCDSQIPCGKCKARNIPCFYSPRKKREYKCSPSELQLQQEILELRKELESSRLLVNQLQEKCNALEIEKDCIDENPTKKQKTQSNNDCRLYLSAVLYSYFQARSASLDTWLSERVSCG